MRWSRAREIEEVTHSTVLPESIDELNSVDSWDGKV